jgi:D-aspartate ligase
MTPLIIGLGINGWNVARALLRGNVRPVVLDNSPGSIFWHSRRLKPIFVPALHGEPLLEALAGLERTSQQYVLISAMEETIAWLNGNRLRVPPCVRLRFPAVETVEMMLDKRRFYEFAAGRGFPIRPMYFFQGPEWELAGGDPLYPCVLKTRRKMYVEGMKKAYWIRTPQDLAAAIGLLRALKGIGPEDLLLQEWVPGGDSDVYFCMQYYDSGGACRASFTGRKIRQWPPLTGGTSSAEPAEAPEVERLTGDFFRSAGMRGICSMEFKRSSVDGRFYMIEPTACRADYQEGVAVANGCNIPLIMHLCESGRPPAPSGGRPPATAWVSAGDDYQSARASAPGGRLSYWQWRRSLPVRREYAVFCREDWGPFAELVKRKIAGRIRRLAGLRRGADSAEP